MPVCVIPLSVGGLLAVKPKPKPADLLAVLITVLSAAADSAAIAGMEEDALLTISVTKPEPKLKPADPEVKPADPEPKPVNPVKPLNAPLCILHKTVLQQSSRNTSGLTLTMGSRSLYHKSHYNAAISTTLLQYSLSNLTSTLHHTVKYQYSI